MTLVCVICSDLLISSDDDIFSTLCGHMFHHGCLLQWLERIKTCPQCRKRTTELDIHKIYFNSSNNDSFVEDTTFCKINTIVIKSVENITNKYEEMTKQFLEQWESNLRQTLYNNVVENCALQRLIEQHCIETDEYKKYTKRLKEKIKKLQKEATNLNKKLREFKQTINQLQQKLKESNKKCKILQQQSVDIDKCKKKLQTTRGKSWTFTEICFFLSLFCYRFEKYVIKETANLNTRRELEDMISLLEKKLIESDKVSEE